MKNATRVRRPRRGAGGAHDLLGTGTVENKVSDALCLGGGVNQKLAIIAKFLEPAGNVGGLILKDGG